jgi:integrase
MNKNDDKIKNKLLEEIKENKQSKKKDIELSIEVADVQISENKKTVVTGKNSQNTVKLNQNIKKKKTLDIISENDFNFILQYINTFDFPSKRNKLALILLYITGIKLNLLLKLKGNHLKSLLKDKFFTLPLKNDESLLVYIIKEHDKYLLEIEKLSNTVLEKKEDSDFIFTKKDDKKTLSRETLTRTLNAILQKAGDNLKEKKTFSTHSFRITYIENLSKILSISEISQIVGHKNVNSTVKYYKNNKLSDNEKKHVYEKVNTTLISTFAFLSAVDIAHICEACKNMVRIFLSAVDIALICFAYKNTVRLILF